MLKLKTKVSLLGIVVLWLICSLGWLGTSRGLLVGAGSGTDSFADVSLHDPLTLLAGYVAAPVVLAVAALHQLLRVRVVATAAAHQVTAVTAGGGFVALPESSIKKKEKILNKTFCFVSQLYVLASTRQRRRWQILD